MALRPTKRLKDDENMALRALFEQYRPALRRHMVRRGASADVDDLLQEVFMRLQIAAGRTSIENVGGYIFRMANNALINSNRRRKLEADQLAEMSREFESEAESFSPERILLGREAWDYFVEGIKLLPERCRDAFIMHRFKDLSYAAIAANMGISVSAVEKLISRALVQLAQRGLAP